LGTKAVAILPDVSNVDIPVITPAARHFRSILRDSDQQDISDDYLLAD